jgi:diphosphomevalonate decarboxylase
MIEENFIPFESYKNIDQGEVKAECSSNIALIKYWGKFDMQLPANPSISYTLTESFTETTIKFKKSNDFSVKLYLDDQIQERFTSKIYAYFRSIKKYLPFIDNYSYTIYTKNSFPHSSGIASSASGFGALALCLMKMCELLGESTTKDFQLMKASFLARLGSGSACRSIYRGLVVWGKSSDITPSSDLYALPFPYEISPIFKEIQDTILLVHEGYKQVSSSIGHSLMNGHPYATSRFKEANKNLSEICEIIQSGDLDRFGKIVEQEALALHAMMMTSTPPYILIKPNTLAIIDKVWKFRQDSKAHLYFTLDAGSNIHLLYPEREKSLINSFIKNDLIKYTENGNLISDRVLF